MMKAQQIILTLVVTIVVGAAGFFGGMQYQKIKATTAGAQSGLNRQGRVGGQGRFGGQNGGMVTRGQVISASDSGITVKLSDGSSKIVIISGSTQIGKEAAAAKSDIQNGDQVMVFGTANSDGSVNAQSVQINPPSGSRPSPSPQP
jgi:hypothetical protein